MIHRIVKMTFIPEKIQTFLDIFHASSHLIRGFEGCIEMHLYRDAHMPNVYFTFSIWESEEQLNKYRNSKIFREIWTKTKINFSEKAEAYSIDLID